MSILARRTREPSGNSPACMRSNRSRFSSTERLRYGLSLPGSVSVPRCSRISSARQIVDVGLAGLDQLDRPLVELVEIVGGVEEAVPVEAEPLDVFHDGVDVLGVFLLGIGVVEAQVGLCRRTRRPGRSSGRSTWRGRCAGSRWAREESASARVRRTCWSSGLRAMRSRRKLEGRGSGAVFSAIFASVVEGFILFDLIAMTGGAVCRRRGANPGTSRLRGEHSHVSQHRRDVGHPFVSTRLAVGRNRQR